MALITTASSANRVVDSALCVTYARRKVYGSWSYTSGTTVITLASAWEYTRTATKNYRYVGMSESAAADLAAVLVDYYTRSTRISEWNSSTGAFSTTDGGTVPMADVVCQRGDGDMWTVQVSVNEQDARMSTLSTDSFSTIFATENLRTYDTDSSAPTAS